jgi:hypothetical protein
LSSIASVDQVHVANWIKAGTRELAAASVNQRLAANRHLFDWRAGLGQTSSGFRLWYF